MLSYRPSIGNNQNKVGVTTDSKFFGSSLGGKLLLSIRTDDQPKSTYYKNHYTDLSNDSTWFFKPITDSDYSNGSITYRALYIGANERYDESEILGTLNSTIDQFSENTAFNNSVVVSLWDEGVYSELTSENTIVLDDEHDSQGKLAGATWSSQITHNNELLPGQFLKVWIKIETIQNNNILNLPEFFYIVNIGSLSIKVLKKPSRLSYSNLFSCSLNDDKIVFRDALPNEFGSTNITNILKILKKNTYTYIFYIANGTEGNISDFDPLTEELRLLVISNGFSITENRYIDVSLTPLFTDSHKIEDISYDSLTKLMECNEPEQIHNIDINGTDIVENISGSSLSLSLSGDSAVLINHVNSIKNKKYIFDVFVSEKEDISYAYIFYAKLESNYTDREILNYNHNFYKWNTRVSSIDLSHVNESLFSRVDYGYSNKLSTTVSSYYDCVIKENFYPNNIIIQDDLFTLSGLNTTDCYYDKFKGNILFLWEKDLILRNIKVHESIIPTNETSNIKTVKNVVENLSSLQFSDVSQIIYDNNYSRGIISGGYSYVNMGSPHQKSVYVGNSSVSFDLEDSKIKEFNSTISFNIDSSTISTDTANVSGEISNFNLLNRNIVHLLTKSDYEYAEANPINIEFPNNYVDRDITVFSINCADDVTESALSVTYNFKTHNWNLIKKDTECNILVSNISGGPMIRPDENNILTVDLFTHEVKGGTSTTFFDGGYKVNEGCLIKNLLNFSVYVNGIKLVTDTTCSLNNVDIYQLTFNPYNEYLSSLSYFDVRKRPVDLPSYIDVLHKSLMNICWTKLGNEHEVSSFDKTVNKFNFKRQITLENINSFKDTLIVPLVLYGNSYNISSYNNTEINPQIQRNVFDFSKISFNKKSFSVFAEGASKELDILVDSYDFDQDILVIWVKLNEWNQEKLTLYYNNTSVTESQKKNIWKDNYYGCWLMDEFKEENINRFSYCKVYDVGETVVSVENNVNVYLSQIDNTVRFGQVDMFKSNMFDVAFDDIVVNKKDRPNVINFIKENTRLFKPAFMEIRNIKSIHDYKLESNKIGE